MTLFEAYFGLSNFILTWIFIEIKKVKKTHAKM